jgi:hypothetical protein
MTSDNSLTSEEDVTFDAPRPLKLVPELPDGRTRRAFQARLQRIGLTEESAAAVARAVVKPDLAQNLLDAPTTYRIPGAELLVIRVEVYASRVIADATNPRTLNDLFFPAAIVPGTDQRALFPPLEPPTSSTHDFTVTATSLDQLVWQLDTVMAKTIHANTPRPPIGEQGVMEPPLAVPARIVDVGGDCIAGAVLVREGSTRVSHAQAILGLDANALLRQFVDDRRQRELIASLNQVAESSASSISTADAAKVRVATMPMDLVVGVVPDVDSQTTLGEAVAAKVAQDHLNHKKSWSDAAKEVHLGEQCLIALNGESLITDDQRSWLAGRLASGVAVDGESVTEDDRWALLVWLFSTRKRPYSVVVRQPIATFLEREAGRKTVTNRGDRVPLAVALAMRSRRGATTDAGVEREAKLLENAVPPIVWEVNWRPTSKSIEDLAKEALEGAEARQHGAAAAELAARAVWYLAKHGQISMPRNDLGPGGDRRSPAEIVTGMLASARGIRQLAQAVIDGRADRRAGMVLDESGTVDVSGVGTPVPLKDDALRGSIVPRSGPPAPPPRDPHGEFMDAIASLGRALNAANAADEDLRSIDDGHGQPMYQVEGIIQAQVDDFRTILDEMQAHLTEYVLSWRLADRLRQSASSSDAGA